MIKASLKVEQQSENGQVVLFFHGALDEASTIEARLPHDKPVTLDLHHLGRVNSAGVQKWITWTQINKSASLVTLRRVSPSFVRVGSVTEGLFPVDWQIESFYVPYADEQGAEPEYILFTRDKHFSSRELSIPATITSLVTEQRLTLDVVPEMYFQFLKRRFPGIKIVSSKSI